MAATLLPRTTRGWSRLLGVVAVALPAAFYAQQLLAFSRWAKSQEGFVCGMPLMAAMFLAVLSSAFLSFLALAVGLAGYRDLPTPRPRQRVLELGLVGLPVILVTVGAVAAFVSALWA